MAGDGILSVPHVAGVLSGPAHLAITRDSYPVPHHPMLIVSGDLSLLL